MKKINNKGYVLVELIISAIMAFTLGYYLLNLTYNFANKNKDLYLSNKMLSYKAIVTKNIMDDLSSKQITSITPSGNKITINLDGEDSRTLIVNSDEIQYEDKDNKLIFRKDFKDNVKIRKQDSIYYKLIKDETNKPVAINIIYYNLHVKDDYSIKIFLKTK